MSFAVDSGFCQGGEDQDLDKAPRKKARLAEELGTRQRAGEESARSSETCRGHQEAESEVTSVSIVAERMIGLEALQTFVVQHLMKSTGLETLVTLITARTASLF